MKKIAMIQGGAVENIVAWEDDQAWWDAIASTYILVDITNVKDVNGNPIDIGYSYDGSIFTPPAV